MVLQGKIYIVGQSLN